MWIVRVLRRLLGPAIGLAFALTTVVTSLFGNYIVTLFLPLVTVLHRHREWRELMDRAISFWMVVPLFFLRFVYGVRLRVTGDSIDPDAPAIIIMNHRTRLDWLYFKLALWRMNPWLMTSYRIALKELLRHGPGMGFGMQACTYIFLRRDVQIDFPRMTRAVEYYNDMRRPYQVLMFPEGTDKTAFTTRRSNDYAKKNNLPELQHLLYPRIAGFVHLFTEMKKRNYLTYIYDVTVAYPREIVQSEVDLVLRGRCSSAVHYDIRRIPANELPTDEEGLSQWLMQVWRDKDDRLGAFYAQRTKAKRKLDAAGDSRNLWVRDTGRQTFVCVFGFFFWVTVVSIWLWHMTFLASVRLSLLFLALNYVYIFGRYGGVDNLLYTRWEAWRRRRSCVV